MHKATYSFTDEYNKLNPAQKLAVETTEGPVLVVAGPGTGKTQILAARVGNILDKGLAFAENILCLTYTEAGVTAMRKRLIKFIGAEAYKVNIHTFHSFCNKVIQDNPDSFGFGEMEPISEIEEIELLEKLIDSFAKNHPLKRWRGQIYYDVSRLKALFSIMKRENLDASKIEEAIEWYLENDYPNQKGVIAGRKTEGEDGVVYQKGDLRLDKIKNERASFENTLAAAKEFEPYQNLKKEANRYDYDDMILDVMRALQNNEWLLSRYQEQFQYFLVDEYQDTNGAQNEILRLLFSYWETPNVFVVGDDDQSIYRFQGANLENIIEFYQNTIAQLSLEEQRKRLIVLKENYRSTQEILDLAATSIENNEERLVNQIKELNLDKRLHAAGDIAKGNLVKPSLVSYPNPSHEVADVANQIIKLKEQGVQLSEIGVLYIQHKQATELMQCLNQKDIAVSTKKNVNILHERFTNMLLDILTYIHEESRIPHSREDLLFNMMHFPFFNIKAIQIARLSFELRESRYSKPKTTWREALLNLEQIFDVESVERIHQFAELTNKWQKDLQEKPVQLLFQSILDDIQALEYVKQHKEKVWLLQELKTLFDFIKDENQKKPTMSLGEFLELIQQLRAYAISIPFVKSSYADEAVQLSSIHGAKGLEYEHVFLLGCVSNLWESKRDKSTTFKLPSGILQKAAESTKEEDLRRLFFVALTRAKKFLQISYYHQDVKGKELTPSLFITDVKDNANLVSTDKHLSDEEIFDFNILQLMQEKISPELIEKNMLKKRLEKYTMSVTHLNNYLECPLKFYYHNFIQIPQAKNASLAFGSAVHDAIEAFFKEMKLRDNVFPSIEEFVDLGKKQLYKQQDSFSKKEYQQKTNYLEKFFPEYYKHYVDAWNKNVLFEKKLSAVYKDINLTGKLDKIEFEGKNISIVDYKTGKFDNKKKKVFQAPSEKIKNPDDPEFEELYGGNYWRQAVFYKILIDYNITPGQRDWHLERTEFDFVEPDPTNGSFHKEKVIISPKDVGIVQEQITNTWKNIQNLNFDGCGKTTCQWCAGELAKQEEDV
jgi:DNA helicase-2/ATP-dependent DNA helicase PcrA